MKLTMFALGKSEKLGLDNRNFDIYSFQDKLKEEFREVMDEADSIRIYRNINPIKSMKHKIRLASEIFDLIQVCIAGLVMLSKSGIDLNNEIVNHNYKLITEREWTIEKVINVDISDGDMG